MEALYRSVFYLITIEQNLLVVISSLQSQTEK